MTTITKYTTLLLVGTLLMVGCQTDNSEATDKKPITALKVNSPNRDARYTIGDQIKVQLQVFDSTDIKDLTITLDEEVIEANLTPTSQTILINTEDLLVGYSTVHISYNDATGKARKATRNIILFSDIIPEQKTAKITKSYAHQTSSYTQGLEFYQGVLYESTGSGDGNTSFIASVDLNTGKHLNYKAMANPTFFGEGMTILNDTIYQLTWQAQECLVYDLEFNYIKSFTYKGEGWGLTNDGTSLIMSNGSSRIAWRNPNTFEVEREIDVFANEREITQLNELELIDGVLWCNVYQDDYLVQVDINNGKVLAFIDCSEIVSSGMDLDSDVLNGIAFDSTSGKTYLTGKLWPKLYEVNIE